MPQKSTYSRRIVSVCREGWYYLFVLTFIAGGATLRQVNTLFALSAMMIAPMLFNWRIAMASVYRLEVRRRLPRRISAGEQLTINVEFTNRRSRLDSFTIYVQDRLRMIEPPIRDQRAVAECVVPRVPVQQTSAASYRCYLNRRGRYRLGPLRYSTRFPMGLIQASRLYRKTDDIIVAPRIGVLTPAWSQIVLARQAGNQQTVSRQGRSEGDYYAMRQWRSGDSRRWIHWRTTARQNQLMVKQFEQQSERDLTIVWDAWQPTEPTDDDLDLVEVSASLTATAIASAFHAGMGNVTLGIASHTARCLSSHSTMAFLNEALTELAVAQAADENRLLDTLAEAVKVSSNQSRVVVISTRKLHEEEIAEQLRSMIGLEPFELMGRVFFVDVGDANQLKQYYHVPNL